MAVMPTHPDTVRDSWQGQHGMASGAATGAARRPYLATFWRAACRSMTASKA
jgi:hypothetical protein